MDSYQTKNERIVKFYNDNPSLNFEDMNLLLIQFLENILKTKDNSDGAFIAKQVFDKISSMHDEVSQHNSNVEREMTFIKESISQSNSTIKLLTDFQNTFLQSVRDIYENNEHKTSTQISDNIQKQLSVMSADIQKEISPILDYSARNLINDYVATCKSDLQTIIKESQSEHSFEHIQQNFTEKTKDIIEQISSRLLESETRLNSTLASNTIQLSESKSLQERTSCELEEYLGKYKKSVLKGEQGENKLVNVLTDVFPSAEVQNVSKTGHSGDVILIRDQKDRILLENKVYTENLPTKEVHKFQRDVDEQKCHGLLLSQNSGICHIENWHIDIVNNKILVYLHNVHDDPDIIKQAIQLIDSLSAKLSTVLNDSDDSETKIEIPQNVLEMMNHEFSHLNEIIKNINTLNKKYQKDSDELLKKLSLPALDRFLTSQFGVQNIPEKALFRCEEPGCQYAGLTKAALAAHKKSHKKSKKVVTNPQTPVITVNTSNSNKPSNSVISYIQDNDSPTFEP